MIIAITDASIFIDLYEIEGLLWFSTLGFEVHTTNLVLDELSDAQLAIVRPMVDVVQELTFLDLETLHTTDFPKGLSNADRSLIWYHDRLNKGSIILFSSDRLIRKWASKREIEVHGILWILDQMVDRGYLSKSNAHILLENLMQINTWLPQTDCKDRLGLWGQSENQGA